uniref:Purple acid phosphatase n=1 Tax=Auxenochlorella protothecoides TaxID=3075 RepID=A0A1D1ZTK8_AUXPR
MLRCLAFAWILLGTLTDARTLIETLRPDGGPVDPQPHTVPYDWSDTSKSGVMRGTMDIDASDPRLQPAEEGFPEQISLMYYGSTSVRFGWVTGTSSLSTGAESKEYRASSVVKYGKSSGKYRHRAIGVVKRYTQAYNYEGAQNYTSPHIHSAIANGLDPGTRYYYRVGGLGRNLWSEEYSFETLPAGKSYPLRLGLIADTGQTYNSSTTYERLKEDRPQVIFHMGDLSYSDDYLTTGTLFPWVLNVTPPVWTPPQTYQPRWDMWGRLVTPLVSHVPFLATPGNHEIEVQTDGTKFASYTTRFPANSEASGSASPLWHSHDVGPVHVVFLTSYAPYDEGTEQHDWLKRDLASVDRQRTPWLIAAFHAPWYTSYAAHYYEANCHRLATEVLLYSYGVDLVLNGHVHAYERSFPVFDFKRDDCGPVHLSLGDGGNIEKLNAVFADTPGHCPPIFDHGPSYQPEFCPQNVYNGSYCSLMQPAWSAFREPSFGHATLDILNDTHALFQWKRNADPLSVVADEVVFRRRPDKCGMRPRAGSSADIGLSQALPVGGGAIAQA